MKKIKKNFIKKKPAKKNLAIKKPIKKKPVKKIPVKKRSAKKIPVKKRSVKKIPVKKRVGLISRIIELQHSLKQAFNFKINFSLEKHIQAFFDIFANKILEYKILRAVLNIKELNKFSIYFYTVFHAIDSKKIA